MSGGMLIGCGAAYAQQAPDAAAKPELIEITGSRIKQIATDTPSPIVTLSAESLKIAGATNVEEMLNNMPQVFAGFGAEVSNGATGTATVDLRGLSPERTLVLVNGRRLPAGDPGYVPADLNQIPPSLVKRVEILTGGASAVYGSDAVAGVVNFVMNDRFQGVQFDVSRSLYNHKQNGETDYALNAKNYAIPGNVGGDGGVTDMSLTIGSNFADNKGNAVVFFGYHNQAAVLQSARDYSACALNLDGSAYTCGGSSTTVPGRFFNANSNSPNFLKSFTLDSSGAVVPYKSSMAYNYGPLNYYQRPDQRYTAAAYAHYDFNDAVRAYSEFNFMDDYSVAQIAPSGLFFGNVTFNLSGLNPLISPAMQQALGITAGSSETSPVYIGRRNVEGGGRQDQLRHTMFRAVAGVKGDIGPWSYDASAQVGKVIYQERYMNDMSAVKEVRALNVVTDPSTGQPVCQSVLDGTDPNCVPYNIWQPGGVTQAALDYLQTPGFQSGYTSQLVYTASGSVDLGAYGVKLPTASSGASLAFGLESRHEATSLNTDQEFSSGDLAGQGGPTIGVAGGYSVRDVFGEFRMPLLEKMPAAENLALSTSYRNSKYSTGNTTNTYGLGLDWTVIKGYQLRGSVQRAVRAPNVIDLFATPHIGLYNNSSDPCAGPIGSNGVVEGGATLAQCENTGVTPAQYGSIIDNPAQQYNGFFGGNTQLKPETSDSYTVGLALQPVRDLSLTLDYFSFKVKQAISTIDPTLTLSQCLATGNPFYCSLIHRSTGGGTLWTGDSYIKSTNANLAVLETAGLDLGVDYSVKMGAAGRMDLSLLGTWLQKWREQPLPGEGSYDCAGLFGNTCGSQNAKWRHTARMTWISPYNLDLSLTWRYIDKMKDQSTSTNELLSASPITLTQSMPAMNYFDLSAAYHVTKNLTARLGIRNLFDKDPPLGVTGAPFGNGNTFPTVYDALGRQLSLRLTASF
ncbi:MAG: TonB-dependent receptor [Burkholderiales bacterium]|nr:TonB-dependent receptor [Burkholderiales bacterium]MDE1927657.1 TonB-dependent receptor [Burkholderiales bacterium]MDE2157527.1 TonB-dependent receptor [Burkholderiales bacterium]MDE2501889.1 TonB-dependent receptor [Burkholderiales bacterium]